ncbi:transposase, partial [Leptospira bourretii]|uniref:transposase n=1 Tax=Leptospira bourretii TaxID=2484962 RepID=UPI001FF02F3A
LSVWWIKLGIKLERIEPGKPQQNGRHERMHKTLKEETALPPRSSLETQQKAFRDFQKEFNYLRPHEGIQNSFPADHYRKSTRKFPKRIVKASYPTNIMIGEVNDIGNLHFEGHRIFLSSALADEEVGLEEISDRHVKIHFYGVSLGVIDLYTGKLLHFKNPMPSSLPSGSGF